MSDKEILEKAIQKAIDGGWRLHESSSIRYEVRNIIYNSPFVEVAWFLHIADVDGNESKVQDLQKLHAKELIYSHNFAKAVWGEKAQVPPGKERFAHQDYYRKNYPAGWQYHLQQMVIAENPIQYLGENI